MADVMNVQALNHGSVTYADGVIASIAGLSAAEIQGVAGMTANLAERISKKNYSRGIKVEAEDSQVTVNLYVTLYYGEQLEAVAEKVQRNVKKSIETMTGLSVANVNVFIQAIKFKEEQPTK